MAQSHMSADDLLRYFGVPGHPRVFVLGCLEPRVTIHDQQVRAANLIWALHETKMMRRGQRLAIIGGGFAGATAGVAAKRVGWEPIVFESAPKICNLQAKSDRWIHPRIYDWPLPGWDEEQHALSFMNWSSGRANDVVRKLRTEFGSSNVGFQSVTVTEVTSERSHVSVTYNSRALGNSAPKPTSDHFHLAILAVGFGTEHSPVGYWDPDGFEINKGYRKWVVAGIGDGGLIDTARLRLRNSDDDAGFFGLLKKIADVTPQSVQGQLIALERFANNHGFARKQSADGNRDDETADDKRDDEITDDKRDDEITDDKRDDEIADILSDGMNRILSNYQSELSDLQHLITTSTRDDTEVILIGPRSHPYTLKATLLNRWIIALLQQWDSPKFSFASGRLESGQCLRAPLPPIPFPNHTEVRRKGPMLVFPKVRPGQETDFPQGQKWIAPFYKALHSLNRPLMPNFDGPRLPQCPESFGTANSASRSMATSMDKSVVTRTCHFIMPKSPTVDLVELMPINSDDRKPGFYVLIDPGRQLSEDDKQLLKETMPALTPANELVYFSAEIRIDAEITGRLYVDQIDDLSNIRRLHHD